MTATLDREDMASNFTGFSYEPVDVSQVPSRPRNGPGRQAAPNPHKDIMAQIAGTAECVMFRIVHPERETWSDTDVRRIVSKQKRLLRDAAQVNERSVRVWIEADGPEVRIYAQDKPYVPRSRKTDPELEELQATAQPVPTFSA